MFWMIPLAIASIATRAIGAASEAAARKEQVDYAAQQAENNAQVARDNARDVELLGRQAIVDQRKAIARSLSDVRAATAGAGLVVDQEGTTPQAIFDDMVVAGELDVLRIRNNIEREKRRIMVGATQQEAQAGQLRLESASISPFRAGLTAGIGALNQSSDILFGG